MTVSDTTYFLSSPMQGHSDKNQWANTFKFLDLKPPRKYNYSQLEIEKVLEKKQKKAIKLANNPNKIGIFKKEKARVLEQG